VNNRIHNLKIWKNCLRDAGHVVLVDGALESTTRRAMLFSRLIDEHNLKMRLNNKVRFNTFLECIDSKINEN